MKQISDNSLKELGFQLPSNTVIKKLLFSYLRINKMNELLSDEGLQIDGVNFIEAIFKKLNINYHISAEDAKNIPSHQPFIIIANHPFGFLDGLIMLHLVGKHRPEFKVLANFFLKQFKALNHSFIELNPFETRSSQNYRGMRLAYQHLRSGHPIGLFPAGEVATMQKRLSRIEDKAWDTSIIRFILNANVPIIPMYFEGNNSLFFHLIGKLHPRLRTLTIPSEFFKQENKTIQLRVGKAILPSELKELDNIEKAGRYIRTTLYGLGSKVDVKPYFRIKTRPTKQPEEIQPTTPLNTILEEISALKRKDALLFSKSHYEVYLANHQHVPHILNELGRLREITFRQVGEGTGRSLDIDEFDLYYQHLFVWDSLQQVIIGAYRLGRGDQIISRYTARGFYTNSLFDMHEKFNEQLSQTLELGRSFIVKDYQQKPLPLFLLWQGILHFTRNHTEYRYLLGPVSISNDFSRFSKELIIAFIKKYHFNNELAKMIKPKKRFVVKTDIENIEVVLERSANDLQKLDKYIAGIEPGYIKIPVLLKQYIRQNAKIIGFNVDPNFNNCLDGLMILDLNDLPEQTLSYLNKP